MSLSPTPPGGNGECTFFAILAAPSKTARSRLRGCAKEPWTVEWIEDWIRPDEVLYDIGANVGAYRLVAALPPAVRARVVAAEPGYPTFAALSDNVGAALHTLGGHDGPTGAAYHQPVLTFRLDDFVERFRLPSPAHVKLDVDGTELDVLVGADRTLSDPGLRTVMAELDEEEGGSWRTCSPSTGCA